LPSSIRISSAQMAATSSAASPSALGRCKGSHGRRERGRAHVHHATWLCRAGRRRCAGRSCTRTPPPPGSSSKRQQTRAFHVGPRGTIRSCRRTADGRRPAFY
jgi:hypothetical protein